MQHLADLSSHQCLSRPRGSIEQYPPHMLHAWEGGEGREGEGEGRGEGRKTSSHPVAQFLIVPTELLDDFWREHSRCKGSPKYVRELLKTTENGGIFAVTTLHD